jgi:hypothetical protein
MDYEQLKRKSYKYWDAHLHENQCYLGRVFVLLREDVLKIFCLFKGKLERNFSKLVKK